MATPGPLQTKLQVFYFALLCALCVWSLKYLPQIIQVVPQTEIILPKHYVKPVKPDLKSVSFIAVGDVQLSRSVALRAAKDPHRPFSGVKSMLLSADFAIGNLESPFSSSDKYIFENQFHFNAPKIFAPLLYFYNFRFLSLANNHGYDNGIDGVTTTISLLDQVGVLHAGSGQNLTEAWQGTVLRQDNISIGFVSATYGVGNPGSKNNFALLSDPKHLKSSIAELKSQSDFVVVMMHAGEEYTREPNSQQTSFARSAVDAGADMVIGHHPHWIQTIESYQGKYIFYSLGNFIFDQSWSQDTSEGLALKIHLAKMGTETLLNQVELLPVVIENNCCPRQATEEESAAILKKIGQEQGLLPGRP